MSGMTWDEFIEKIKENTMGKDCEYPAKSMGSVKVEILDTDGDSDKENGLIYDSYQIVITRYSKELEDDYKRKQKVKDEIMAAQEAILKKYELQAWDIPR